MTYPPDNHRHGGETYELVLIATPHDGAPPIIRLRHVLKSLLRTYAFRCVSVRDVTPYPADRDATPAQDAISPAEAADGPPTTPDAS